jgi:hypothetical protein
MKKILQSYCAALPLLYVLLLGNALLPLDAYAQTGQVVTCGQTASTSSACTVGNLTDMFRSLMSLVISVGLPILTIFIFFRFFRAWFSLQKGDTSAYHTAVRESGHAIVGFAVVIALFGGALYTLLSYFGVKEDFLKLLKLFSAIPFDTLMAFVPHAYAQTSGQLPSPVELNIYDFLLAGMRLVMRFFIYPGLIIMWVWTGFLFVAAQGAPDAINKAKRILYWTVIMTLIFVLNNVTLSGNTTLSKRLMIVGKGPGSNLTGNLTVASGALGSNIKDLRVEGNITFNSGADKCFMVGCFQANGYSFSNDPSNLDNVLEIITE